MHPGGNELDGLMLDAIRGQPEEYDGEDYYDEEELDLQEQDYDQQLAGPPGSRPGCADRPYADEQPFDQADAQ